MQIVSNGFSTGLRNGDLVYDTILGAAVEDLPSFLLHHCRFEVVQLEQGKSCCDLDFVVGSQAVICRKRISLPLHLRGLMTGGCVALGLVYNDAPDNGAGHPARDDLLFLALPGVPFDWFLRGGQTLLLVMASQNALMDLAQEASAGEAVKAVMGSGNTSSVLRVDGSAAVEARSALLDPDRGRAARGTRAQRCGARSLSARGDAHASRSRGGRRGTGHDGNRRGFTQPGRRSLQLE